MKKTVMVLAILFFGKQLAAQIKETRELKKLMIGFNIGGNYTNVLTPGDHSSRTYNGAGFRLGLVMSEEVTDQLTLSPKAELSFNDSHIEYTSQGKPQTTYEIYPVNIDLMWHLNYKLKHKKFGPYILAGPNIRVPIKNKETGMFRTDPIYGNNPDVAIDLGFGFEKLQKYFCLAPELRYSIGLLNVNKDPALDHVYFHNVTLVLNFKS